LGRAGLDWGEEERVYAQGAKVVDTFGKATEWTAVGWAEVGRIYVVDDSVFPPRVGVHTGAGPARTGEGLGRREGSEGGAGEKKDEESAGSLGHTLLLEMLRENLA
jgi:hypothetical protein